MARSRDEIMLEWDKIASGYTTSSPRDWLDAVMDEQDHIISGLVREIARLRWFEDAYHARQSWLDEAKRNAGVDRNTPFDAVWADALAALIEKRIASGA